MVMLDLRIYGLLGLRDWLDEVRLDVDKFGRKGQVKGIGESLDWESILKNDLKIFFSRINEN